MPAGRREALAALFALDERFAAIVAAAREPLIGRMRLVWWRDALERLDHPAPPGEPLLRAIAAALLPIGITGSDLAAMEAGWAVLLPVDAIDDDALRLHGTARGEALFALGGHVLATPPVDGGRAWAMNDLWRRGLIDRPTVGVPQMVWPVRARPLGMLVRLARRDLARRSPETQGSPARLLAMAAHRLTGR